MLSDGLTAEQRQSWEEQEKSRKSARERMWLLLLVSEIDEKARLSSEQREKLEITLLPLCKDLALLNDLKELLEYQSLAYLLVTLEGVEGQAWKNGLEPWQVKAVESTMAQRSGYWSSIKARIDAAREKQLP